MTFIQTTENLSKVTKPTLMQKICNKLGENNKPIFTVMAIACGKGTVSPTTLCAGLAAENLTGLIAKKGSTSYKNTKAVLSLLGICVAAGYLVPQFCNIFMPPVMKKLMPSYDPNGGTPSVCEKSQVGAVKPLKHKKVTTINMYPMSTYLHSGMKV